MNPPQDNPIGHFSSTDPRSSRLNFTRFSNNEIDDTFLTPTTNASSASKIEKFTDDLTRCPLKSPLPICEHPKRHSERGRGRKEHSQHTTETESEERSSVTGRILNQKRRTRLSSNPTLQRRAGHN
ncbi:hypothetical protein H6P81_000608 [Aristolochia fimbriata]|uniref:Uncharacterized protein n=1 Tax=Aristolochia fimbriata TaxID=158543 RepID=A0AAV7F779_ARIFI|nr:hypothetical protein H6P81_000608 [Aristolochia fimbriata]